MKYYDIYRPTTLAIQPYVNYDNYNLDNAAFNNWSSSFDWNVSNSGKYITNLTGLGTSLIIT